MNSQKNICLFRQKETKKIRNLIWNQSLEESDFWMLCLWYERTWSLKMLMYFWETKIWENNSHQILCMQNQENDEKEQAIDCESARNLSKDEWEDQKADKVTTTNDQKTEEKSLYHFYEVSILIKHFLSQRLDHSWFRSYHTCFQQSLSVLKFSESITQRLSYCWKFRSFNLELQRCNSTNYKRSSITQECDLLHELHY